VPRKLSLREIHLFTLQLSVMLEAGLHLSQALEVLGRMGTASDPVAQQILKDVDSGRYLSVAMFRTGMFNVAYLRLIRAGEASGQMHAVLRPLAEHLERSLMNRTALTSALAYPAFVLLASSGMLAFLIYFQLPQMLRLTADSGGEVPWLTRTVMFLVQPAVPLVLGGLALVGALAFYWTWKKPRGRRWLREVQYRLPLAGPMLYQLALTRITRDLYLMWHHGVELMQALRTLCETPTGCPPLDRGLVKLTNSVEAGQSLSDAMAEEGRTFPKMLMMLVRSGEESGRVTLGLQHYTTVTEDAVHGRVKDLTAMLEPLMLLVMGLLVGVIVLASLLPVYGLMMRMA